MNKCEWYNGIECEEYEEDGSKPTNIGMKHLKLSDNCVLVNWVVSWSFKKESIEINSDSFGLVKTFKIDVLTGLKTIKISNNIINQIKNSARNDRS